MKVVPCALLLALITASVVPHQRSQGTEHASSDELDHVGEGLEASGSDKKVRFSLNDEQEDNEPHLTRRKSQERFIKSSAVEHTNKDTPQVQNYTNKEPPQVQDHILADLLVTENMIKIMSFTALILFIIEIIFGSY